MSGPGKYISRSEDLNVALQFCQRREYAVQAGGHIGVWPKKLAGLFQHVYTFEPDAENFACLTKNLEGMDNVIATQAALASIDTSVRMKRSPKSTGQHKIEKGKGNIPAFALDTWDLEGLDLLCLDVEGFEIPAITGAVKTIEHFRPVIMAEENKRCTDHGFKIGHLGRLLKGMGYRQAAAVNEDLIFTP